MHAANRLLPTSLAFASLLAVMPAQALDLGLTGGSLPGNVVITASGANFPFETILIVPSATAGPTPCSIFDPLDPRSLDVGLDLVGSMWAGFADLNLQYQVSFTVPAQPALQDLGLYFQAVTLQWQPTLLDRISNGNVVRLGNANSFRDRGVQFGLERAFASVLPRPDHKWLLVGGARGQLLAQNATATNEIYDPIADAFSPGPSLNAPRSMHAATELPNGTWLITGGVNATNDPQATCEIYDPVADTFTPVATMLTARMGHTATLLANGKVLVTGGLQAMTVTPTQLSAIRDATNATELYDPANNTWTAGPNLLTPRAGHVAMKRPDGKVLLAGGISWDNVIIIGWLPAVRRSCDLYDPVANTVVAGPQMATARSLIDPIDIGGGRFLVAGGIAAISLTSPGTPTATAEIYNANTNTWTTVGSMAAARGNHKGWSIGNGQYLLTGGAAGTILSPTALSSTEIFSTATNTFTPGPAMTSPRAGAATFLTPQGQMQVFGGGSTGGVIARTTEWYFF